MEAAWNNHEVLEQLTLRKDNWPTSILNQCTPEKLVLFGIDIDQGNEIYLTFSDATKPQVVSYFEYQENRYDNFLAYLEAWTK